MMITNRQITIRPTDQTCMLEGLGSINTAFSAGDQIVTTIMTPGSKEWPHCLRLKNGLSRSTSWVLQHSRDVCLINTCSKIPLCWVLRLGRGGDHQGLPSRHSRWPGWTEEPVSQMVPDIAIDPRYCLLQRLTSTSGIFLWNSIKINRGQKHLR